jgi:hypothetical protein
MISNCDGLTMDAHYEAIRELIRRARARWRALTLFRATIHGTLAAAAVLLIAVVAVRWVHPAPAALLVIAAVALALAVGSLLWAAAPLRVVPSDLRVARFIEEREPSLDDRLVSAIDVVSSHRETASPAIAEPMLADAAARARAIDVDAVIPSRTLQRRGAQAAAAAVVLAAVMFAGRTPGRQAYDAAALVLFPERVRLDVTPGNARVTAGNPIAIEASLAGNRAPVTPQVQIQARDGDAWRQAEMAGAPSGRFRWTLDSVTAPFKYRVLAGPITSPTYSITVAHPPRVARIDVDYTYPSMLGLQPRTEEDSGDIYAPAGTDVRIRIHTDRPAASGQMTLANGKAQPLAVDGANVWSASLKLVDDTSYRIALTDRDGLSNPGDTEYFIRTLADRPPEVHIVKPASDRAVNRLDEVDIEAQADDDYGIERLDLVYSVRGGPEKSVPFEIPRRAASVSGRQTLYLEDLDIQPGDFVSYYARARDLTRGKRSSEARSDIFFLEVKPFEQEFAMAQSQSMAGSGYSGSIDDLINAQKQVVVATWKIDRRSRSAKGAQSEQDIRAVARTEADLKSRVEQTSSSFRESTMRDPRRRTQRGRGGQTPDLKAGQSMAEEDEMGAAAEAMARAVTSLDALKTGDALSPEMEALNHLLKAQADVKRRQVSRQQAGAGGPGNNNRNYDVSTLFDKELQRAQQTNYETPTSAEQKQDADQSALDKIRELARRQDELLRRQEELQRSQLSEAEMQRELEKLTREQTELRQKLEELARQNSQSQQSQGQQSKSQQSNGQQSGQQSNGQTGASGDTANRMREISEEMRSAANDLRRQNSGQARARGERALEKLRDLEKQMQAGRAPGADERRRALGDMQLESRQLADAQRRVAGELSKAGGGEAGKDTLRKLAGEQEQLAARAKRLQDGLKQQASGAAASEKTRPVTSDTAAQSAAGDAARDLERQRLAERMQKSADDMRGAASQGTGGDKKTADAQQEMARALDKVADKLASAGGLKDADSRKASEQLARAQQLRDRMASLSREMEKLGRQNGPNGSQSSPQRTPGESGRSGDGRSGGGAPGGSDLARLRDEYERQMKETQDLLDQMRREDPSFARGGAGFTFEGQGMTLSAPGTEAFKQDFAKWEEMRKQATTALDHAEAALSKKLQAQQAKDRLAAGVEDKAPPEYQKQVDSYFKALAAKKKQ